MLFGELCQRGGELIAGQSLVKAGLRGCFLSGRKQAGPYSIRGLVGSRAGGRRWHGEFCRREPGWLVARECRRDRRTDWPDERVVRLDVRWQLVRWPLRRLFGRTP